MSFKITGCLLQEGSGKGGLLRTGCNKHKKDKVVSVSSLTFR
ncbi:MAG: hypothetical protein ACXVDW_21865 [Bacteroidia bacterium]